MSPDVWGLIFTLIRLSTFEPSGQWTVPAITFKPPRREFSPGVPLNGIWAERETNKQKIAIEKLNNRAMAMMFLQKKDFKLK